MAEVTLASYIADRKKKNPSLRLGSLKEITESQRLPSLTTGNVVADYVTSIGGLPRGAVTEIRGQNSSGKTTLAAMAAAKHQKAVREGKATGAILYMDFEYAVSPSYFAALGIDTEDKETFIYYQPDNLEEGFQTFLEMTKAGLLAMGIVDSVAGASAEAEYEATIGKLSIGQKAKALHQSLRMCVGPMRVTGTGLILINHTQVKIPQTFGEKQAAMRGIIEEISPGGKAIEYYTSLRLNLAKPTLNKTETHDELTNEKTKQVTSTEVTITAFKNKLGIPHRTGKMRVHFGRGFSQAYSSFQILVDHDIIKKKAGGNFTFPEQLLPEGMDKPPVGENNIIQAIEDNPEWEKLVVQVAEKLVLRKQVEQVETDIIVGDDIDNLEEEDGVKINPETGEIVDD